jgi:hypothetical protein
LAEVSVPTAEGGWRDLLEPDGRGSQPYLGVGAWGDTDPAGAAAGGAASGSAVTLTGIPLGNEPVTVDWGFTFSQRWFDATLTWHVNGPTSAPVRELSWSLDTAATPATHDNAGTNRNGDVAGFPQWTVSTGGGATAAVAYRSGSARAAANRWYGHWYSSEAIIAFQSVQSAGGASLANGTYSGGRWRIGVTPTDNDTTFAQRLHTGVNS